MANGQRQITAFHLAGDMSDLHSVVVPTASWSITALSDTKVMFYEHKDLRELVETYPGLPWRSGGTPSPTPPAWSNGSAIWGERMRRRESRTSSAKWGCAWSRPGPGTRRDFDFPITQEQLADAAGLTPVHTNRVIQELRGRNLLTFRSGKVEILDWDALTDEAEFDPGYLILRWPGEPEHAD